MSHSRPLVLLAARLARQPAAQLKPQQMHLSTLSRQLPFRLPLPPALRPTAFSRLSNTSLRPSTRRNLSANIRARLATRGRLIRYTIYTVYYGVWAVALAVVAILAGVFTVPKTRELFLALVAHKGVSDAETLQLYNPPDALSKQIDDTIVNHPIALQLRNQPDYIESRPGMKIPEALRSASMTSGVLAGPGRIAVPPLVFQERSGKDSVTIYYLGQQLSGHPGIVHGGLLATLLDEGLGRCCFPALPSKVAVTAELNINYRKPAVAGGYFVLRAQTVKVEGRKAWVQGRIERMPDNPGESPVICVEGTALFVEPKNAQHLTIFVNEAGVNSQQPVASPRVE